MKQLFNYAPSLKRVALLFTVWLFLGALLNLLFTQEQLFFAINSHYSSALNYIMYGFTLLGDGLSVFLICMIQFVYLEISKKKYKTSLIINNAFLGTLIGNFVNTFLINLHTKSSNKITNTITFSLNAILVNYLPGLVTQYLKHSFNCERPLKAIKELHKIHTESWWPVLHYNSFPSGHTTSAFALLIFMTVFIFPKNNKVVGLLFAMAIMVGISRIYLAAHFFKDIYLGSIVGFSIAILVILGYQLFAPKKHKIYVQG